MILSLLPFAEISVMTTAGAGGDVSLVTLDDDVLEICNGREENAETN